MYVPIYVYEQQTIQACLLETALDKEAVLAKRHKN